MSSKRVQLPCHSACFQCHVVSLANITGSVSITKLIMLGFQRTVRVQIGWQHVVPYVHVHYRYLDSNWAEK
jgi:hypothetical protein